MTKARSLSFASLDAMPTGIRRLAEPKYQKIIKQQAPQRSKYNNSPTTVDGIRFDSKKEASYYRQLKIRVEVGEVLYFLMQVPLRLPGGTKYVVDFVEFHSNNTTHYIDVKGKETAIFRLKKREIEHQYPIRIEVV